MIFRAVTFTMAALVGVAVGTWVIERDPPIVMTRVEVETPEVTQGDNLRVHYFVNRLRLCQTHIDRMIVDKERRRFDLPDIDYTRPIGSLGEDDYKIEIPIPKEAAPGSAVYRTLSSYRCNLIHQWFWPIVNAPHDVYFRIKERPQ